MLIMDLKEEKIMVQAAQHDPEAFGRLYDQYYRQIFNYILRRVTVVETAQDITSEVFLKAFQKLWLFKWKRIPFSSWLYKIAIHEISNYFRKNNHQSISLDELKENTNFELTTNENPNKEMIEAQTYLEQHREFLKIQKAMAKLPLKYQTVLSLKFFEHKKIKEIAQILNKREGTVKSLVSRGLNQLKALVN